MPDNVQPAQSASCNQPTETAKLKSSDVCDLVRLHVEQGNPDQQAGQPHKVAAFNFAGLDKILSVVDAKTQEVMPVLNVLLPGQWDAIAKIVAAAIHTTQTIVHGQVTPGGDVPVSPAPSA